MAPEIRNQKAYDGHKVDTFSIGVILFITVLGIFPFLDADLSDPHYQHIAANNHNSYWLKLGVTRRLSQEFRDLFMKMVSLDPAERPTVNEIRNHPWMQERFSMRLTKANLIEQLRKKAKKQVKVA